MKTHSDSNNNDNNNDSNNGNNTILTLHHQQMMKQNGILPEWIDLNKQIFSGIREARHDLLISYRAFKQLPSSHRPRTHSHHHHRSPSFAPLAVLDNLLAAFLPDFDTQQQQQQRSREKTKQQNEKERQEMWEESVKNFREKIQELNKKVLHYNLLVLLLFFLSSEFVI